MLERIAKDTMKEKVLESKKKTVLMFKSEFCPHCRKMTPVIEELAKELGDQYNFFYVDVTQDADLAVEYGITGVPTTVIFENGKVKETVIGFQAKDKVKALI